VVLIMCVVTLIKSVYLQQNEVTLFVEMFAFKPYVFAFAIIFGYNFFMHILMQFKVNIWLLLGFIIITLKSLYNKY